MTRQPVKTRTEPSSIVVGIATSTDFLHGAEDADEIVVDLEDRRDVPELLLRDPEGALRVAHRAGAATELLSGRRPWPGSPGPASVGRATILIS